MPIYTNPGDALKGDKIAAEARSIDKIVVNARSSSHRGQFTTLRGEAYCVIDIPLKWVQEKKTQNLKS